jgi:HSP20 family protein
MTMAEKESKVEAKEEKSGKAVSVQRAALAPFKGFEERFEQMERFMDRMMGGFSPSRWMRPFERDWPAWSEAGEFRAPAVDLIDRENEILVRAELPGAKKEDISISLAADSITIQAQSSKEATEEKGDYRRREISSSAFSRSMWLPVEVDTDAAKAVFKDGVLEVTLPKTAAAKGRNVPIE